MRNLLLLALIFVTLSSTFAELVPNANGQMSLVAPMVFCGRYDGEVQRKLNGISPNTFTLVNVSTSIVFSPGGTMQEQVCVALAPVQR